MPGADTNAVLVYRRLLRYLRPHWVIVAAAFVPATIYALLGTPVSRANPKFLALKAFHERIFQAYRAGEWDKARGLIEQCRGLSGANPVLYDFYLKRIAHLESHPSSADWGGRLEPAPV